VYQFVTSNSIEDAILKRSKKKIALETIVVKKKDTSNVSLSEMNSILSFGTKSLFEDEGKEENAKYYSDEAITTLLDRKQSSTISEEKAALGSFNIAAASELDTNALVEPTAQFWDELFASRHEEKMRENFQLLGRGVPRKRLVVQNTGFVNGRTLQKKKRDSSGSYTSQSANYSSDSESDSEDDSEDDKVEVKPKKISVRSRNDPSCFVSCPVCSKSYEQANMKDNCQNVLNHMIYSCGGQGITCCNIQFKNTKQFTSHTQCPKKAVSQEGRSGVD
jgi:hypothetical protein